MYKKYAEEKIMEKTVYYFIKNNLSEEVWTGYKFKKGSWRKAMLYKKLETASAKVNELISKNYNCTIKTIIVEEI
jgi:hypothetical protein